MNKKIHLVFWGLLMAALGIQVAILMVAYPFTTDTLMLMGLICFIMAFDRVQIIAEEIDEEKKKK